MSLKLFDNYVYYFVVNLVSKIMEDLINFFSNVCIEKKIENNTIVQDFLTGKMSDEEQKNILTQYLNILYKKNAPCYIKQKTSFVNTNVF